MPSRARLVRVPTGLRLHVREWDEGTERDHTIVVLHGFLDHGGSFAPLVEAALARRAHVLVPDQRGHGDSDRVGAGGYYHFLDYVADLDGLVRAHARARVTIIGHSMGGMVANYYTGTYPERVSRLALLEGLGPPESELGPERMRGWLAGWRKKADATPRTFTLADGMARLRNTDPELVDEALARRLVEEGADRLPDGLYRWKHDPLHLTTGPYGFRLDAAERFWAAVRCPVLFVEGGGSVLKPATAELRRREAAFAAAARRETVTLPGAGHMMHRHHVAALAAVLGRFLDAPLETA